MTPSELLEAARAFEALGIEFTYKRCMFLTAAEVSSAVGDPVILDEIAYEAPRETISAWKSHDKHCRAKLASGRPCGRAIVGGDVRRFDPARLRPADMFCGKHLAEMTPTGGGGTRHG